MAEEKITQTYWGYNQVQSISFTDMAHNYCYKIYCQTNFTKTFLYRCWEWGMWVW